MNEQEYYKYMVFIAIGTLMLSLISIVLGIIITIITTKLKNKVDINNIELEKQLEQNILINTDLSVNKRTLLTIIFYGVGNSSSDLKVDDVFKKMYRELKSNGIEVSTIRKERDINESNQIDVLYKFNSLLLECTQSKEVYKIFNFYTKYAFNQNDRKYEVV